MEELDVRWMQRFNSYSSALTQVERAVALAAQRPLSELEQQGLIQGFEFTHELAWNAFKDFLESRGAGGIYGSKDATREAFRTGLIDKGEIWMDMVASRNKSSHTYNSATADEIAKKILESYIQEFRALRDKLEVLKNEAAGR